MNYKKVMCCTICGSTDLLQDAYVALNDPSDVRVFERVDCNACGLEDIDPYEVGEFSGEGMYIDSVTGVYGSINDLVFTESDLNDLTGDIPDDVLLDIARRIQDRFREMKDAR